VCSGAECGKSRPAPIFGNFLICCCGSATSPIDDTPLPAALVRADPAMKPGRGCYIVRLADGQAYVWRNARQLEVSPAMHL
jgi:hypothetical protein